MTLGERIKIVRKNNNLNQTLFAESIGVFDLLLLTKNTSEDGIDKSRTKETLHKEIDKLIDFHNKI